MTVPERADVVVIGGGPAGSLAATYLSQKGYAVVLLEKQTHPRYAVGESMLPDFWKYCDEAGVTEAIQAEGFLQKAGGCVDWQGATYRLSFRDFGYRRPALHVERDRLDHVLLSHARTSGAQVCEAVAVTGVDFGDGEGATVRYRHLDAETDAAPRARDHEQRITCRYVVDASGQNGVVSRQLGIRVVDDGFRFMSVWGYFENASYLGSDGDVHPASSLPNVAPTTYVTALPHGDGWAWLWSIILRRSTSVGLVLPHAWVQAAKVNDVSWEAWFLSQCHSIPMVAKLLEPARFCSGSIRLMRDYSYRSSQVAGPGFFLIGDAAGFVDPIFSVGLVLAMYTAYSAAWSIDRCLQNPARRADHQALFSGALQSRLELGRALALPFYQPSPAAIDHARAAVSFADRHAKELMYAAALLVARAPNFTSLIDDPAIRRQAETRLRPLTPGS